MYRGRGSGGRARADRSDGGAGQHGGLGKGLGECVRVCLRVCGGGEVGYFL